jgi:hypothetical protein
MNYLQRKKLAFMNVVNSVKGFVRKVVGIPPITLPNCVDNESVISYSLYGNSMQDGTPSPDNPVEVEGVGEYDATSGKYKIPVVARGKNLFDISKINSVTLSNGAYITNNQDGTLTIGGLYTANSLKTLKDLCPLLKVGDVAVLSAESNAVNNGDVLNRIYVADGTTLYFNTPFTVTQAILDNRVVFYSSRDTNGVISESYYKNIQIEIGRTVTEYEPYKEPITTDIYLDEPLMGIGKAFDYIDFESQKVVRKIGNCLLGIRAMRESKVDTLLSFYYVVPDKTTVCDTAIVEVLSPSLLGMARNMLGSVDKPAISSNSSNNVFVYLYKEDVGGDTNTLVQSYLSANPITIYYELATPVEESIDLQQLPTFKGTTVYEVVTEVQPSNMEVTYYSSQKGE